MVNKKKTSYKRELIGVPTYSHTQTMISYRYQCMHT